MEFRLSLLLLAVIIGICHCQLEEMQEMLRSSTRKYCGSHLAQALSTICQGNYNTVYKKQNLYQKRTTYWDDQYASDMPADEAAYPFQKRSEATSMLRNYGKRKRRGVGRGVYNECCEKSCSREELSSYCALPYKRRR